MGFVVDNNIKHYKAILLRIINTVVLCTSMNHHWTKEAASVIIASKAFDPTNAMQIQYI